jgi:hypothetical protein
MPPKRCGTGPETSIMTRPLTRTDTAKRLALGLALALFISLLATPPQAQAQVDAAPAPADAGDAGGSDQPQRVATSGGTFWNSIGYLMVTLLVGASLYAVCRSSHRN